jgi:hypothetical protein
LIGACRAHGAAPICEAVLRGCVTAGHPPVAHVDPAISANLMSRLIVGDGRRRQFQASCGGNDDNQLVDRW